MVRLTLVLACTPAAARASATQESIFQDDDHLLHTSPAQSSSTSAAPPRPRREPGARGAPGRRRRVDLERAGLGRHLQPQTIRDRKRRLKAIAPLHYRKLFRARARRAARDRPRRTRPRRPTPSAASRSSSRPRGWPRPSRSPSPPPRAAGLTQFLLRDDEPRTMFGEGDARRRAAHQTGIKFEDDRPKPAYATYRLPLRAVPRPDRSVALWGMIRPGGAQERIRIEFRGAGASEWRSLGERAVNQPRGYWTETIPPIGPGLYRFEWLRGGGGESPPAGGAAPGSRTTSGEIPVVLGVG